MFTQEDETTGSPEDVSFHDAPSVDEVANKLLEKENLAMLNRLGISEKGVRDAWDIARDLSNYSNEDYKEKHEKFRKQSGDFLNDKSHLADPASSKLHSYALSQGSDYVMVNIAGSESTVAKVQDPDEKLLNDPSNTGKLKVHIQVPDNFVPFVGLLAGIALLASEGRARSGGDESFGTVSFKLWTSFRSKWKAEGARIVLYIDQPLEKRFKDTIDTVTPLLELMDIGGLKHEAFEDDDVMPPVLNTPVKKDGKPVPNLYMAFGHSMLRDEMHRRGIIGQVFDESKNYAIPRGYDLSRLEGKV